jgi:methionyl-tRNA formyltransferase
LSGRSGADSGSASSASANRPRTVFFGSPAFAVPSLERVAALTQLVGVVTQPDRPAGRGQTVTEPPVKQVARRIVPAVPILQPEKLRTGALESQLRELGGDLFIVVAYGRILPPPILELPRLGPWNVHASLLPRLRGAAPIQWAIINGDSETGVSVMRMEVGLDTGPVAAVAATPINDDDTAGTLSQRLAMLGAELLATTLPRIADQSVVAAPQDDARATLAPILRKEDGHLDFSRNAQVVSARARGVDPWPGATAMLGAEQVKLFGARVVGGVGGRNAGVSADVAPGTVLAIGGTASGAEFGEELGTGLAIACADQPIVFAEIQLPGRKRLPAAAAAAGRAIAVGARFG